jgi:hypothetical protein
VQAEQPLAARASGESGSFTKAQVTAPRSRNQRVGPTRSGLWPDCEKANVASPSLRISDWYRVTSDIGIEVTSRPSRAMIR